MFHQAGGQADSQELPGGTRLGRATCQETGTAGRAHAAQGEPGDHTWVRGQWLPARRFTLGSNCPPLPSYVHPWAEGTGQSWLWHRSCTHRMEPGRCSDGQRGQRVQAALQAAACPAERSRGSPGSTPRGPCPVRMAPGVCTRGDACPITAALAGSCSPAAGSGGCAWQEVWQDRARSNLFG